jgi:hypothetical protein
MLPGLAEKAPNPQRFEMVMMTPIWAPYLHISTRASMIRGHPAETVVRLRMRSLMTAGAAEADEDAPQKRSAGIRNAKRDSE